MKNEKGRKKWDFFGVFEKGDHVVLLYPSFHAPFKVPTNVGLHSFKKASSALLIVVSERAIVKYMIFPQSFM